MAQSPKKPTAPSPSEIDVEKTGKRTNQPEVNILEHAIRSRKVSLRLQANV